MENMPVVISKDGVKVIKPNIKYINGKVKILGTCWVKGDWLECYGWEDEEQLFILDKIPASEETIPEDQYYVWNSCKSDFGWVLRSQITFELSSLFGEPYRVREV